jgi:hypothetical protein
MYKCHVCHFSTSSVKCYVSHYRVHANVSNFRFPCGVSDCSRTFVSFAAFNSHCSRDHNEWRKKISAAKYRNVDVLLQCESDFCGKQFKDLKSFLNHLKSHISDTNPLSCPYKECTTKFQKTSTFTAHISRKHKNWNCDQLCSNYIVSEVDTVARDEVVQMCSTSFEVDDHDSSLEKICQAETVQEQYVQSMALFLLKMQSSHLLSAAAIQEVVNEMALLHDLGKEQTLARTESVLKQHIVDTDKIESICSENFQLPAYLYANSILHTDHLRKKYFRQQFSYVSPESVYFGINEHNKAAYAQYIPVKDTLEELMKDSTIVFQLLNPLPNSDAVLQDYSDAELCKSNSFMQSNPKCLKLILFQDAFEIVNPLGSAKSKHKLVGVYMTLANFYPQSRSKISHIQLVQLMKEKDLKFFGASKVFSHILKDLQQLEEHGVELPGHEFLKVVVVAIVGDNLGSHYIGGFSENFSCGEYFCRFCDIARSDFHNSCLAVGSARTAASYEADLKSVNDSNGCIDSCHGIKQASPFNMLTHYHVAMPGLPPCLGHDLFEGVVDYDLAAAIRYFVKEKKWFTYQFLNRTVANFKCLGCDAANKPSTINEKGYRLGGHAVQNWTFVRLLPLILGNRIRDVDDGVWQMCLLLREVVELVCAPRLSISQIAYMETVIKEYIEMRMELFPSIKLRPKHHYLLHYPRLTHLFGPLIRMWSMRFESKHSYFKRVARHSQNFKNVTKTLAERHQLYQAYISTGERFVCDIACDHPTPFTPVIYCERIQTVIAKHECLKKSSVFVAQQVSLNGTLYKTDLFVLVSENEQGLVVGRIIFILIHDRALFLLVELHPCLYKSDIGVYVYTPADDSPLDCISVDSLLDALPLPLYVLNGLSVLPLRHKYLRTFDC